MIGVIVHTAPHEPPAFRWRVLLLAGEDNCGCRLPEVEAQALDVEGPARQGREGLERQEARCREGAGAVGAAYDGVIVIAAAKQPVGQNLRGDSADAGVAGDYGPGAYPEMGGYPCGAGGGAVVVAVSILVGRELFDVGLGGAQDEDCVGASDFNARLGEGVGDGAYCKGFESGVAFDFESLALFGAEDRSGDAFGQALPAAYGTQG